MLRFLVARRGRGRAAVGLVLVSAALFAPTRVFADEGDPAASVASASSASSATPEPPPRSEKQACAEAYKTAQVKRDAARLLDARGDLRVCSRPACPGFIAKDCTEWLAEVESRVASVVLSAKEGDRERLDVAVTLDDRALTSTLDGRAIEVDPGLHTFVFVLPSGARREVKVAVKEGGKAQVVAALFPGLPEDRPALGGAPATPPNNTLRFVGYGAGGVGLVALGVGAVFGARAIAKNADSKNDCDADNFCGPEGKQARADAQAAATLSTAGVAVGAVLLAGGVTLVLLAPKARKPGPSATLAPMLSGGAGGLWMTGRF